MISNNKEKKESKQERKKEKTRKKKEKRKRRRKERKKRGLHLPDVVHVEKVGTDGAVGCWVLLSAI